MTRQQDKAVIDSIGPQFLFPYSSPYRRNGLLWQPSCIRILHALLRAFHHFSDSLINEAS